MDRWIGRLNEKADWKAGTTSGEPPSAKQRENPSPLAHRARTTEKRRPPKSELSTSSLFFLPRDFGDVSAGVIACKGMRYSIERKGGSRESRRMGLHVIVVSRVQLDRIVTSQSLLDPGPSQPQVQREVSRLTLVDRGCCGMAFDRWTWSTSTNPRPRSFRTS
jgi:hypothetical protein